MTKENNQMLHAMRRSAFWGGIFKFIIYAVFLLAPLWFYMQYLSPIVNQALKTMQQAQSTGASAQTQLTGLQDALKQLQSKFRISGKQSSSSQ